MMPDERTNEELLADYNFTRSKIEKKLPKNIGKYNLNRLEELVRELTRREGR